VDGVTYETTYRSGKWSTAATINVQSDLLTASFMLMALVPSVAANLLEISATRQAPHANGRPPELAHQLCQSPARASTAAALRDLKNVKKQLRGNALDSVVANLTVQPF
jgi:hypothetical protein